MNKHTRSGVKIGWVIFAVILLVVSAPLTLYLLGASLFFFGWNGAWGGERSQSIAF